MPVSEFEKDVIDRLGRIETKLDNDFHALHGNGKPGLIEKVAALEEKVNLMMDHINSYKRKKLNDQSPHQLFSFLYGADVLETLNSHLIDPSEITLKPELLK